MIVDASIAVKWFVAESGTAAAEKFFERNFEQGLGAPELIVAEVTNAAWKKVLRGEIPKRHALGIARSIEAAIPRLFPIAMLAEHACEIAIELRHPVYDCLYLACADLLSEPMATVDTRILSAVANTRFGGLAQPLSNFV
jgi:predicted nucleic acid-binding protein